MYSLKFICWCFLPYQYNSVRESIVSVDFVHIFPVVCSAIAVPAIACTKVFRNRSTCGTRIRSQGRRVIKWWYILVSSYSKWYNHQFEENAFQFSSNSLPPLRLKEKSSFNKKIFRGLSEKGTLEHLSNVSQILVTHTHTKLCQKLLLSLAWGLMILSWSIHAFKYLLTWPLGSLDKAGLQYFGWVFRGCWWTWLNLRM